MNSQHRILWEERKLGILNNKPYDDIALEFVPSETDPEVRIPVRVAYFKKCSREKPWREGEKMGREEEKADQSEISDNSSVSACAWEISRV